MTESSCSVVRPLPQVFDFHSEHNGVACIASLSPDDFGTARQFRFTAAMLADLFDCKKDTIRASVQTLVNTGDLSAAKNLATAKVPDSLGRVNQDVPIYDLDVFNKLAMTFIDNPKAVAIRSAFNDVLVKHETAMPQTFAEALRAYANEVEAREHAEKALAKEQEQHRKDNEDFCTGLDILNQTKSRIATRQLATAMNTASQKSKECARLTKENESLKDEVGRGKEWQTTSDMTKEWIQLFGHKPDGKKLTSLSMAMGVPCPKDVLRTFEMGNSGRYREDHVKRYRKEVWDKYREIEEQSLA